MTRRELIRDLCLWALVAGSFSGRAFADAVRPLAEGWRRRLWETCEAVGAEALSQQGWQAAIESLLAEIPLPELLTLIDFERLKTGFPYADRGAATRRVSLPPLEGLGEDDRCFTKIFGLERGRAIIPHGHRNMVSAHLVLEGEFALKHYDREAEADGHWIVAPTIERAARRGSVSSISDVRDNVHWFRTTSERAFTFDVIVTGLDPQAKDYETIFLDPEAASAEGAGKLRMPVLSIDDALAKYGKEIHH